jgi:hypothetical protein
MSRIRSAQEILESIRNRKRYPRLDRDIIAGIADADLLCAIEDVLRDHVLVGGAIAAWMAFQCLPPGPSAVWAIHMLDIQVKNGGFAQFFWNDSGRYAPFAFDGLQLIGAPQHAAIVQEAMDRFVAGGAGQARQRGRDEAAAGFTAFRNDTTFAELDRPYYRCNEVEPLEALQVAYVRAHVEEFVLP